MKKKMEVFSNQQLKKMIVPLFFEQFLVMLVGMADTLVVSYAGEAAVSGVSLVNQFNTIFIYLFTALASGGAVVISQYIGRNEKLEAGACASQLLLFSTIFSGVVTILMLWGNEWILKVMFGKVEAPVMEACVTYLRISSYSYPALAIYNSGAAVYRSMGKTDVTMYLSMASNIINVIGNLIGVFVLQAGVAGVAYPSLIARTFSAVIITWLCFLKKNEVFYQKEWIFQWNGDSMKKNFADRCSQWHGKRCVPTCKGSSQQYRSSFWNVSDSCQWCGSEHLVIGGIGWSGDGAGIYHSYWAVHGKPGYRRCGLLF